MAIAIDNHAFLGSDTSTGPFNSTFVTSGSNRALIVSLYYFGGPTITGITYNGISLTLLANVTNSTITVQMYGLLNPTLGSNTISISYTGVGSVVAQATSYTGVSQSGLPDAVVTLQQAIGSTSISNNITVIANNSWVITAGESNTGTTPTVGSNITLRDNASAMAVGDSNGPVSSGSFSQTWNISNAASSAMIQVSLAPFGNNQGNMFLVF